MWVGWVITVIFCIVYPQLGAYFISQRIFNEKIKNLFGIQHLITIILTLTSTLIYSAIAILFKATPD